MTTKYKFAHAHEWLGYHLSKIEDPDKLRAIVRQFAISCDSDVIQDMFEKEMDADGYFEEQENEPCTQ